MLEIELEKEVVKWAESMGGIAAKLKDEERGFPDRTVFLPGGIIAIVELKRPKKNKRYHMQKVWIERLEALGFKAKFCTSLEEVKQLVEG